MDTVCDQDAGSYGRAARLAWRSEVLSVAFQYLAVKLADRKRRRSGRHDRRNEAAHAFDIGLIAASGLFDSAFYLAANEDVVRAKLDPLQHYLWHGGLEGRRPSPAFDGAAYLASYEDLREAGVNPLLHYLKFGVVEGRAAGAPAKHPAPRRLADVLELTGSTAVAGLVEIPASLPDPSSYAAALDLKAVVEAREGELAAALAATARRNDELRTVLAERAAERAAMQDREAAHGAEAETLRAAREAVELRLYVANASLQRAVARGDALMAAQQADEREKDALRQEREDIELRLYAANASLQQAIARNDALMAAQQADEREKDVLRQERDDSVARLYAANASLQQAIARNDALMAAQQADEREKDALRQERDDSLARLDAAETALQAALARSDQERRTLEEELATLRAAVAAGRNEVEAARSELAKTAGELAIAARELMLTGRELQRLQGEEGDHLQVRAERDALRLHVATLERDLQHGREQEAALIASRAEAAVLNEVRTGLASAAQSTMVTIQLSEARDQLAGRLELLTGEIATLRRGIEAKPDAGSLAARTLYLDLLEAALTGLLTSDENMAPWGGTAFDPDRRLIGRDWPRTAVTMIGTARMRNLRRLLETALDDGIEGDVLEAGVWRGGACIYMRGILAARGIVDRTVWVADSFAGLPPPDAERHPADQGDEHHTVQELAISLDSVRGNFARFGLLDDRVAFLPGWFKDTLSEAPVERLAVLRLDGDMYGSTIDTLETLYAKVSPGGFIIVDDYILKACRAAVDDYRTQHNINEPIIAVDGAAVYWRKAK
ncbi:TylF/MycF/NovP-related O-methyltransferase [Methylorubrum populi]